MTPPLIDGTPGVRKEEGLDKRIETVEKREAIFDRCRRGALRGNPRSIKCLEWVPYFNMHFQFARGAIESAGSAVHGLWHSLFSQGHHFERHDLRLPD